VLQQLNLPLKRNNVDKGKNPYGNLLLYLCRGNDLFIVNGRIGDNKEGNLTCRNASVVDYTICSSEFLKNIVNMSILDFSRLFSMFIHRFVLALIRLNLLGKKKQIKQIIKVLKTYKILKNGIR
jgi:hypothetical protein